MSGDDPAMPFEVYDFQPYTGQQIVREQFSGLTKRELFAAMAMQGLCANTELMDGNPTAFTAAADIAVYQADALLAALKRTQTDTKP